MLVTFPVVTQPTRRLVGSPDLDVWNHAWGPWWWWDSLSQGQLPWQTSLLKWPSGGVLWFIDPILAALGAPLVPLLGPWAAYNIVVVGYLAFGSWAVARFARSLGAVGAAPLLASVAFIASAYVSSELHNGISEAFDVGWVALALAFTEDAARRRGSWAKAGLGVGMAAVASPYLGLAAGIAALVRGLPDLRRAWVGALVAVVVAAPPALLLRAQLRDPSAIVQHPDSMNAELALHNAVDPRTFVAPFGFQSVDLSAEGFLHSGYLGILALALAVVGVARLAREAGPRWRAPALLWPLAALTCAAFALGPYLYWDGGLVVAGGGALRLPWWGVQALAPGLAVTHPLRLAVPVLAIVAALAAVGASRAPRWAVALLAVGLLADGLGLSGAPWPAPLADPTPPPALVSIARPDGEPVRHALLDLPTDAGATMATSRYLAWQAVHRRPIPYGPDARASTNALLNESAFRPLARLSRRRADEGGRLGLDSQQQAPHAFALADLGVRWIALHHDLDPEAAARIEVALTAELGPGVRAGETVLWDLGAERAGDGPRRPLTPPRDRPR